MAAAADLGEVHGLVGAHRPTRPTVEGSLDVGVLDTGPADDDRVPVIGRALSAMTALSCPAPLMASAALASVRRNPNLARPAVEINEVPQQGVVDVHVLTIPADPDNRCAG